MVNLNTGQYWLNFHGEKRMSDHESHVQKAVLYKSHFPRLRHSVHQLLERHQCIHRLINHVYNKDQTTFVIYCPTTVIVAYLYVLAFQDQTSSQSEILYVFAACSYVLHFRTLKSSQIEIFFKSCYCSMFSAGMQHPLMNFTSSQRETRLSFSSTSCHSSV